MSLLYKTFIYSVVTFLVIYLLRAFGWLSFIPGGIVFLLLFITLTTGLIWGILATLRY